MDFGLCAERYVWRAVLLRGTELYNLAPVLETVLILSFVVLRCIFAGYFLV